ncbi:MAG: hypothetical protein FP814_02855 [Desulfobacterium sp.]|nr:hypothetical protein [Desulfobacterium sp.]MBU3946872.1 hypothetical protein [Pseudomonadota bacterium]MBU4009322.1 hypothetical protein [Pseudomonadota bacterium]MBU4037225.1 hypothetical protein [Pseudomonadota bacterium]
MHTTIKKSVVILTIITLLIILSGSTVLAREYIQTETPDAMAMLADFVAVRPFGIASLVTGSAVFVLSSPFSALGGNIASAWDKLVAEPAKYTFKRPLGYFNN